MFVANSTQTLSAKENNLADFFFFCDLMSDSGTHFKYRISKSYLMFPILNLHANTWSAPVKVSLLHSLRINHGFIWSPSAPLVEDCVFVVLTFLDHHRFARGTIPGSVNVPLQSVMGPDNENAQSLLEQNLGAYKAKIKIVIGSGLNFKNSSDVSIFLDWGNILFITVRRFIHLIIAWKNN